MEEAARPQEGVSLIVMRLVLCSHFFLECNIQLADYD